MNLSNKLMVITLMLFMASSGLLQAAPKARITVCEGEYALCASSTGTVTGNTITIRTFDGTLQEFPETLVTCPILKGPNIAGLNSNTMKNSCKAPKGYVYSTFWPKFAYPQESQNWQVAKTVTQVCSPQPTTITTNTFPSGLATQAISQCWSMKCKVAGTSSNGVPLAECSCALGESPTGGGINPTESSVTGAGDGVPGNTACNQNPVSGAIPYSTN